MRTNEEINKEYADLCMKLGDLQVKKKGMEINIDSIMERIKALSDEMKDLEDKSEVKKN